MNSFINTKEDLNSRGRQKRYYPSRTPRKDKRVNFPLRPNMHQKLEYQCFCGGECCINPCSNATISTVRIPIKSNPLTNHPFKFLLSY